MCYFLITVGAHAVVITTQ